MEWLTPDATIDVRQGDLLVSKNQKTGNIDNLLIVITADCDISKGKFGSHLAGLKVIFFDEYLKSIWGARKLEKITREERKNIHEKICKHHSELIASTSKLTEDGVIAWLLRDTPQTLCNALQIPESGQKKFITFVTNYANAFKSLAAENGSPLSQYVNFFSAINSRDPSQVLTNSIAQAKKDTLPDDVFFLPCIPDMEEKGAVVLLREIIGIPYASVRYRLSETDRPEHHLRSARLKPEIKYALSQAFGSLYSKIGLSAEYESRRKFAIDQISSYQWS